MKLFADLRIFVLIVREVGVFLSFHEKPYWEARYNRRGSYHALDTIINLEERDGTVGV